MLAGLFTLNIPQIFHKIWCTTIIDWYEIKQVECSTENMTWTNTPSTIQQLAVEVSSSFSKYVFIFQFIDGYYSSQSFKLNIYDWIIFPVNWTLFLIMMMTGETIYKDIIWNILWQHCHPQSFGKMLSLREPTRAFSTVKRGEFKLLTVERDLRP